MWNCSAPSSLLLPFSDDYVKCEASNSPAGTVGSDKMLPTDYDHLCHHMSFSPSFQRLQTPALFATRSSESYLGESSIYNGVVGPAFMQFSSTQPATAATHLVKWTAAGEPMAGDGSSFRGSKRLKTTATATAQGPQHRLQCSAKPRNQTLKAPCKRNQRLGDKITALQQLVSPYGKTDTASVLHEAAACIRNLHEQIQVIRALHLRSTNSGCALPCNKFPGVVTGYQRGTHDGSAPARPLRGAAVTGSCEPRVRRRARSWSHGHGRRQLVQCSVAEPKDTMV